MDIKSETSPKNALKPYGRGFRQKKRSLTSVTTNSSSDTDVNANFGFGPPFLFSLPEPIDDQWKLKSELTLRDMGARPVSTHALRRILERRKLHNFFDNAQEKSMKRDMKERTDETSDDEDSKSVCSKTRSKKKSNDDLVHNISRLLDLGPRIFLVILLYKFVEFLWTIQQAVDVKVDEYSQEMLKSISECSKNYLENRCAPGDRVPALESACTQWEKCMNRDPTVFARAKISAEAFGEIINNLMEQFSYKTMLFMVGIVLAIFLSRALIELFKTRFLNNFPPQTPNTHPGIHSMPSSPTPITPMQVHSVSPIQHRMSPSTSIENPMASQHSNVGVYYVVTPTR